ncbi:GNAT family N-acetyltransferase [Sphingomonas sp. AP4-R1]|uniref:GNAT family N-acetyltransferase n=1 Tax=Sphingomonas sp. AP4-R1 TaxID=2735134 RepID=UPI0014938CD5|nr:GNAT family N-acetyltransferase [Sphingomonas sp. AP4-R1]QJU56485.1 GNAT family N-acetyltransferase [Sphingomonas sp. AP4-R1]
MTPPVIAPGSTAEIEAVMRIMDSAFDPAFGEAWNRGQVLGILSLSDVWLILATPEGELLPEGFALARQTIDEAELLLLAVRPEARMRGIGRALVEAVADEARGRGALRLMLEMRDGNPALALYSAAGFGQIGRRRDYYRGRDRSVHDAITLARPLGIDPNLVG